MRWNPSIRTIAIALLIVLAGLVTTVILFLRLPWMATETVSFRNGDVTLVGTLVLPRWHDGPYPATVIIHGSGSMTRWVYFLYARHLMPHGMAALIYDKRGTGDSSGTNPQETRWSVEAIASCGTKFDLLAGDALAAVHWLKSRNDIDASRIGLAGLSQAGWIMPLAASKSADVAFIISISGPAVSCGLEDWHSQLHGEYAAYPEFGGPVPYANGKLSEQEIDARLDDYDGPQGYDPVPVLSSLTVPTLWVFGGRDESVPTARSVTNLERLIAKGAPFDLQIYPEANHFLKRPDSLRRIDYWQDVRVWLHDQGILTRQ